MIQRFLQAACILVACYAPSGFAEPLFSNFYFFGDSLTDIGNASDAPYTHKSGTVWSSYLAEYYGVDLKASKNGGTNWAYVGDQTGPEAPNYNQNQGVIGQVQSYLAQGSVDSRALYTIWAGANDIKNRLIYTQTDPSVVVNDAIRNLTSGVQQLSQAGARYIMVLNIPDLALTPLGRLYPEDKQKSLTQLTNLFNETLMNSLNQSGIEVIQIDINSIFTALMSNPGRYGLSDVSHTCGNGADCDPTQYFFYDLIHPTPAGHRMIADSAVSAFQGPILAASLTQAPLSALSVSSSHNMAIRNELLDIRTGSKQLAVGKYRPFVSVSYAPGKRAANDSQDFGYESTEKNVLAGIDYRLNDATILGIAVGQQLNQITFGSQLGSYKLQENILTAFGGYQLGKGYINSGISLGLLDFNNYQRTIKLGAATDVATAKANGHHVSAMLEGGYQLVQKAGWKTGPVANLNYQAVYVKPFVEHGATPGLNLQYYAQHNESLLTGFGWQGSYQTQWEDMPLVSYGQLTVNKEWLKGQEKVTAGMASLPGSHYSLPLPGNDRKAWALMNLGFNAQLQKHLAVGLSYQTTFFRQQSKYSTIMANLQIPLD